MIMRESHSSRETENFRVQIKKLNVTLKNNVFDGNEPIKMFDFLPCFINEADMLNISAVQERITVLKFLADGADIQFGTNLKEASHHGRKT